MSKTVLYQYHFTFNIGILSFLIPLILGLLIWRFGANGFNNKYIYNIIKVLSKIIAIILIAFFVYITTYYIYDYLKIKKLYENNQSISKVEGIVENLSPESFGGHGLESFTIDNIDFSYKNSDLTYGYHISKRNGGVIKENGQHLEIKYCSDNSGNKIILYIAEIKDKN